jgi:hypothetical protein
LIFELLAEVVGRLDGSGIPHMLAGSVASTYHGEPRTTQDIDLVIDPDERSLAAFAGSFDPVRFYVGNAMDALRRREQFNVIDTLTGWKVDLIIRKDRPFSREEFARRRFVRIGGVDTWTASAEDTVLAKLEWLDQGGSDRQLRDVVGILAVQRGALDEAYLDLWAADLGVTDLLGEARRQAADGAPE